MRRHRHRVMFTICAAFAVAGALLATAPAVGSDAAPAIGDTASPAIPAVRVAELANSVHSTFDCMDCHVGVGDFLKAATIPRVDCSICHDEAQAEYEKSIHFKAHSVDAPGCTDCHGTHDIRAMADSASMVAPRHQAFTCSRCHSDPEIVRKHDIPIKDPLKAYQNSVHGWLTLTEGKSAAMCSSCHGAHAILPSEDMESSVHRRNIPATCGHCHPGEAAEFVESIHGKAVARGKADSPDCNDCHSEHGIQRARGEGSPTAPGNVSRDTCGRCHASERLEIKYGIAADRVGSFQDSYHGLAMRSGNVSVANCGSCHGVHNILPSSDPRSMIAPVNLEATCGTCHENVSANFANGSVHMTGTDSGASVNDIVRTVYLWLILLVIGGMVLHNGVDFIKRSREVLKNR